MRRADPPAGPRATQAGTSAGHALALARQGRLVEAKAMLETLVAASSPDPDVPKLLASVSFALGDAAAHAGDVATAIAFYDRSIAVQPGHLEPHYNKGVVLYQAGRVDEASASYERALAIAPRFAAAHSALGELRSDTGDHEAALRHHGQAVAIEPGNAEFHNNFGLALDRAHRHLDAVQRFDAALAIAPEAATAWSNRGVALHQLGRLDEALASADRAIALDAADAEAWSNRGLVLHDLRRYDEALAAHEKATRLAPSFANAWANLGATFGTLKRHGQALAAYDRALAIEPGHWQVQGDRLHTAMLLCDWKDLATATQRIVDAIEGGHAFVHPFVLLPTAASPALQKQNAARWLAANCAPGAEAHAAGRRADDGRIRLGYFSTDFRGHAMMELMAEVFERHDRGRFECIAFSLGSTTMDAMRSRAMAAFDRFIDVGAMGDLEIAALSRSLGIDVAIDLNGYTQGARPGIFAARAAPVQVNYLGYPGTTAAPWMDYLIADRVVVPAAASHDYSEQIAWMPHTYLGNQSWQPIGPGALQRRDAGLPDDGFVFCSFNNSYKITPDVFDVWMRLLVQVPGSVLWLIEANAVAAKNLRGEAVRRGVAAERIVFAPRTNRDAHLARHGLADLFVDTLHYGAHTTASDALRAGLPVLTCLGESFPSRVAASLCRVVGLDELVTGNVADYEAQALALATEPARLAALRRRLAEALPHSPLFDAERFARDFEALYTTMHERRLAGLPPAHLG